jgi:hypothetical protein
MPRPVELTRPTLQTLNANGIRLSRSDLGYDVDHNFKLNSWSYKYPRFTKPFYYGRTARGMAFILMFKERENRRSLAAAGCRESGDEARHFSPSAAGLGPMPGGF